MALKIWKKESEVEKESSIALSSNTEAGGNTKTCVGSLSSHEDLVTKVEP